MVSKEAEQLAEAAIQEAKAIATDTVRQVVRLEMEIERLKMQAESRTPEVSP